MHPQSELARIAKDTCRRHVKRKLAFWAKRKHLNMRQFIHWEQVYSHFDDYWTIAERRLEVERRRLAKEAERRAERKAERERLKALSKGN